MNVRFTDNSNSVLNEFNDAIARALERIGIKAEDYAQGLCPVDTGTLRNSISHETDKKRGKAIIGTNEKYAAHVEFGTYKQKAQPYLKPAVADHANTYANIVKDEMKNG